MRTLTTLAAILALAATASAATIKVPRDQPTIQAAATAAVPGDTIAVSKGVYKENVTIGTAGVTLKGSGAVLDGNVNGIDGDCLTVAADNVIVTGMTFRNGLSQVVVAANGVQVVKCTFYDASQPGIAAVGNDLLVDGCKFYGLGDMAVDAVGDRATVRKSLFRHCGNGGIEVQGTDALVDSNTFQWVDDSEPVRVIGDRAHAVKNKFTACDQDCVRIDGLAANVELNKADRIDDRLANIVGDNATVQKNTANYTRGGVLVDGSNCQVLSNKVTNCTSADAISVTGDNVTVVSNKVTTTWDDADGVSVDQFTVAGGGLVERNKVTDTAGAGFNLDTVFNLTVRSNTATRCADDNRAGFVLVGDNNVLEGNKTTEADNLGFLVDGNGNSLTSCTATKPVVDGFRVLAGGTANSFTDCTVSNAGGEGFDNRGAGTILSGGKYRGLRFDIVNDAVAGATFADPTLAGVDFKTGGATQQPQVD